MIQRTTPHRLLSHLQNVSRGFVAHTSVPYSETSLGILSILLRQGLISNVTLGNLSHPTPSTFASIPVPEQRIWINMKYRNGTPVLRHAHLVSKPSVRILLNHTELGLILTGRRAKNVSGAGMGEVIVVRTGSDKEAGRIGRDTIMDGWEAWRRGLGGEIMCRLS